MTESPRRPAVFATKFVRVMTRCAAAQELGPSVCWMLTVIAGQEDAPSVRYRRPVTYYFDQLMPLCGFRSRKQLSAAIKKAVDAGWQEYTPGAKSRPGKFRVLIPGEAAEVDSGGCDESSGVEFGSGPTPKTARDLKCGIDSEPHSPTSSSDPEPKECLESDCSSESEPERSPMRNCKSPQSGTAKGALSYRSRSRSRSRSRKGSAAGGSVFSISGKEQPVPRRTRFRPPTVQEVRDYCREQMNSINPEYFVDHYEANGWTQGRGRPIRDWRAAIRTWEKNGIGNGQSTPAEQSTVPDRQPVTLQELQESDDAQRRTTA